MIARIRKSIDEKDRGFTLIELLVVMIIIGILAAIAIPVFLNQRKKANDTAAVSDVSTLGKEIATFYVDATAPLATTGTATAGVFLGGGRYAIQGNDAGKASNGVTAATYSHTGTDVVQASTSWCVEVVYSGGSQGATSEVSYSAQDGLDKTGGC
ncbi:type II secretion system protein [Cellulomonas xiejunii]|uniref:Prepilin-type N-terminal cleavage/methylation domain-containing protein n=1 Tax=Cellulomonas xiejunii TaxID=2968083 RepID=A0ABY5KVV0_9CELL|nr:prepilin-type N-terminal cleavage/methylation domain-containing protein [Cellulomonas xiejunii]MCC2314814.1 prepilin-type N-terminal cleavage/methylation domain-containing protein [Cellulomonas xiejunii]MCC2323096.1 prepilin-type N-terminal cleavage/methylation domain-containing protein [Cellulomonas xiejunii]UUI73586.1 prepilin-type N-terminal cleavage/methylation domain-containing protein [Cellulomonas xiejunii]